MCLSSHYNDPDGMIQCVLEVGMIGIIDVGTNSIHLRIAVLRRDGRFAMLWKEQHLTRLGGEQGLVAEVPPRLSKT